VLVAGTGGWNSGWYNDPNNPKWVQFNFGSPYYITSIVITAMQSYTHNTRHVVYGGLGENPETIIGTFTGSTGDWSQITIPVDSVLAQYVKFTIPETGDYVAFRGINIVGEPSYGNPVATIKPQFYVNSWGAPYDGQGIVYGNGLTYTISTQTLGFDGYFNEATKSLTPYATGLLSWQKASPKGQTRQALAVLSDNDVINTICSSTATVHSFVKQFNSKIQSISALKKLIGGIIIQYNSGSDIGYSSTFKTNILLLAKLLKLSGNTVALVLDDLPAADLHQRYNLYDINKWIDFYDVAYYSIGYYSSYLHDLENYVGKTKCVLNWQFDWAREDYKFFDKAATYTLLYQYKGISLSYASVNPGSTIKPDLFVMLNGRLNAPEIYKDIAFTDLVTITGYSNWCRGYNGGYTFYLALANGANIGPMSSAYAVSPDGQTWVFELSFKVFSPFNDAASLLTAHGATSVVLFRSSYAYSDKSPYKVGQILVESLVGKTSELLFEGDMPTGNCGTSFCCDANCSPAPNC